MASRIVIRVRAAGAAEDLARLAGRIDRETGDAVDQVGSDALGAYRRAAPKRTRNLERGIGRSAESRGARRVVVISGSARNPLTGYDYFDVTRFGVRGARIYPRLDRAPASVVATRRARGTLSFSPIHGLRGNAALRFVIGGRVFYRRSVKAYHPSHDWAEDAQPAIDAAVEAAARRLAERLA